MMKYSLFVQVILLHLARTAISVGQTKRNDGQNKLTLMKIVIAKWKTGSPDAALYNNDDSDNIFLIYM